MIRGVGDGGTASQLGSVPPRLDAVGEQEPAQFVENIVRNIVELTSGSEEELDRSAGVSADHEHAVGHVTQYAIVTGARIEAHLDVFCDLHCHHVTGFAIDSGERHARAPNFSEFRRVVDVDFFEKRVDHRQFPTCRHGYRLTPEVDAEVGVLSADQLLDGHAADGLIDTGPLVWSVVGHDLAGRGVAEPCHDTVEQLTHVVPASWL